MTNLFKARLVAGIALSGLALAAIPAAAQVNGLATADSAVAIASSQPLQTGYQQVATTFAVERQTLDQQQQQRNALAQTLDTDGDGQLSEAEAAVANDPDNATVQQIQALEQLIAQTQNPIQRARIYVIEQIALQYNAAVQQVVADNAIQMIITPEALAYAPQEADVTTLIAAALSTRVPSVSSAPPANWQPQQQSVQLFQQIQQILLAAARQQAAQAAAAEAAQPAAAAAAPATTGR